MQGQTLRLLITACRCNLSPSSSTTEYLIMKEFHLIARAAQALLAVGMTLITGLLIFA
jgi:hypothetical protein